MTRFASSSAGDRDDATLARAAAAGDRSAFAEIYDRYADRLHDFCIGMLRDREAAADCVQDVFVTAATKLVQLREPDRLRSWLYAIARSEALARIRARKREQLSEEIPEMPSNDADMATMAARTELADLIADASGGLSERDRVVLELAYRQGLDGPELAEALGVTPKNANTLVERLRETIARSLGALLVCRRGKADPDRCPELAAILDRWDGEFTPLMRKRVARHIDSCVVCEGDRARMVRPAALLPATPLVIPAPAWLREPTLDQAIAKLPDASAHPSGPVGETWWPPGDFDEAPPRRRRLGLGAALVLLAIGGAAVLATQSAYRVAPVDDSTPLTTSTTSAPTTTPSIAQRPAPSAAPSTVPPALITTSVVIAPAPETTPAPAEALIPTADAEPSTPERATEAPTTTEPRQPARTEQSEEPESEPEPQPDIEPPPQEPTQTKPTFTVPKAPPADKGPDCAPTNPACNGGGGPVFS
jgi:RNA polymerase sigma factor (sigma-70 family)